MPNIKIINNTSEITLNNNWVLATKFKSINRLVDEKGNRLSSDYKGHQYKIIEKRERSFSSFECFKRGFLGTLAVACTLCLALFSKSVRNLFTKSKENIRFAILEPSVPPINLPSSSSLDQNVRNKTSEEKINKITEEAKNIAATKIQSLFRGHLVRSEFKNLKNEHAETLRIQEEKRKAEPEKEVKKQNEGSLKKTEEEAKESSLNSVPLKVDVKRDVDSKPVDILTNSEFLTWLKEDNKRLENKRNTEKLISIIKNEEVPLEELQIFYEGLSESIVLQILNFTQTVNSFNAVSEKIIEKALILETNFIQALNKKCPRRNLELCAKIEQRTLGPSIFRHSMQEKEIQEIGVKFFEDLRKSDRLLTKQEFDQVYPQGDYWKKGRDLGRIQGANYIKRVAEELGLKHIKVPKKMAVLNEEVTSIQTEVNPFDLEQSSDQITIFAENITPLNRGTTREEVTEFLKILEATGFADFLGNNFMLGRNLQGEEGIYFIDTEYMNFRYNPFLENNVVPAVTHMVQKEDWDWINQPDGFGSYRSANKQRIMRYLELYDIKEVNLGNLLKTYVPEAERRKDSVKFTYNIVDK